MLDELCDEDESAPAPIRQLDERRAHQCRHDGCDSAAVYEVYLHVRYGRRHKAIEHLKSSIRVCDKHRKAAGIFLTSEHNKKVISTQLATIGRLAIDWPNAVVEFVPIGEESWSPEQMVQLQTGAA